MNLLSKSQLYFLQKHKKNPNILCVHQKFKKIQSNLEEEEPKSKAPQLPIHEYVQATMTKHLDWGDCHSVLLMHHYIYVLPAIYLGFFPAPWPKISSDFDNDILNPCSASSTAGDFFFHSKFFCRGSNFPKLLIPHPPSMSAVCLLLSFLQSLPPCVDSVHFHVPDSLQKTGNPCLCTKMAWPTPCSRLWLCWLHCPGDSGDRLQLRRA